LSGFVDSNNFRSAIIRLVVYLERELYEKGEVAARMSGVASVEQLMVNLLEEYVRNMESEGYDLTPEWMKRVIED